MNSLVCYDDSDEESEKEVVKSQEVEVVKTEAKKVDNKEHLQRMLQNVNKLKSQLTKKVEYFDENYHMKLESELLNESVDDTALVNTKFKAGTNKKDVEFSFPQPKYSDEIQLLTLDTDFFDQGEDDDKYMNPETINLNLIHEQELTEIPANTLISEGLLTGNEQRGLKRAQNIDISTIQAKKIFMTELTANRPLDIKSMVSGEELSKLRAKTGEEPDKNAKRQHQITWLASKAKEREFELMTTFSDPSFSRSEARNKYGF